jgi:hypothetical protein
MQPFGSDRVRVDGERIILSSRIPKDWHPRVEKTLTSAEFPGTAVLWEEQYFEVVSAEGLPQGGARYVLEPWRDHLAMRTTDRYDAEREGVRVDEHRRALRRETSRKSANALALLTGHLPAVVQRAMADELGLLPARLTLVSVLGMYVFMVACICYIVAGIMAHEEPPFWFMVMTIYIAIENTIRFGICWTQSRPAGSSAGWIGYLIYYSFARRGVSPFGVEKGTAAPISEPTADVALRDYLHVREAWVTLLPASDQERIAERFGYDHRGKAKIVAIVVLVFALFGVVSSFRSGAVIGFIIAGLLAGEQIFRLTLIPHRPAGSILGFLVRPALRKLL